MDRKDDISGQAMFVEDILGLTKCDRRIKLTPLFAVAFIDATLPFLLHTSVTTFISAV